MQYINLINHYWKLREQGILNGSSGDLYLYLLHTSNGLGWKNPFHQTNALICGFLGISEKKLIVNRNKLKQEGLIEFQAGRKGKSSGYTLKHSLFHWKNSSINDREKGSISDSEKDSKYAVESAAYIRQEKDKTKKLLSITTEDDFERKIEKLVKRIEVEQGLWYQNLCRRKKEIQNPKEILVAWAHEKVFDDFNDGTHVRNSFNRYFQNVYDKQLQEQKKEKVAPKRKRELESKPKESFQDREQKAREDAEKLFALREMRKGGHS